VNPAAARALEALPQGLDPEPTAASTPRAALARAAEEASHAPMPLGRLRRGWILGTLPPRIAAGYFAAWIRSSLADDEGRERARHEAHLTAALRCLGTMTYLRGAVAKAGQLLAAWPTLVPDEFAETLAALHFEAPPMHYALVSEVVRAELGGEPDAVFAEFDRVPFAAASLGQVHRARRRDGEEVAVKVQYPGIARTIRSDLANLSLALLPMRFTRDGDLLREQLDDVAATLARETDYEQEAAFQERARESLADLDEIVVPRVHRDLSSPRVLTMERLHGTHLRAFLAGRPSQDERDARGRQVMHAVFRLYYGARLAYADPHPGNFLFLDDGRLGLLDFGCCRAFDAEDWALLELMEDALRVDGDAWTRGLLATTRTEPGALRPEQERAIRALADWMWEPLRHEGPFDLGSPDYFPRGVSALRDVLRTRATRSAPLFTWVQRSLLGVRAMTYQLGSRVDMRALHRRESEGAFA